MDTTPPISPLTTLGQRMRQARRERGLSQEALAAPEFTKSYVSAVERGKARPSLKALELMARRLGQPVSAFLELPPGETDEMDMPALEEDLTYQIDCARRYVDTDQAAEGVRLLNAAEQEYASYLAQFSPYTPFRLYYTRAAAYIRLGQPAAAQTDLLSAGPLAEQLGDGGEAVERVRNALGAVYYQQDQHQVALEHHLKGLRAIHTGVIQDVNLRLLIYSNLANDYWALNDIDQAISTYKEALTLLEEVSNIERQAGIYWGLSLAYKARGDLMRAKIYARRALDIYEAAQNLTAAAQMQINLAELLVARQEYQEAEHLLAAARRVLEPTGDPVLLSRVYEHYSLLALAQNEVEQAATYAQRSLELIKEVYQPAQGDTQTRANMARTYARALRTAGLVAERQGQPAVADSRFREALALPAEGGPSELAHEIRFAYAEVLSERGAYQEAAVHYRIAAQHHLRPGS